MNAENINEKEIQTQIINPEENKDDSESESIATTPQEKERLFRLYELFVKINKRLSCKQ